MGVIDGNTLDPRFDCPMEHISNGVESFIYRSVEF